MPSLLSYEPLTEHRNTVLYWQWPWFIQLHNYLLRTFQKKNDAQSQSKLFNEHKGATASKKDIQTPLTLTIKNIQEYVLFWEDCKK